MKRTSFFAAVTLVIAATALPAQSVGERAIHVGLMGGATNPAGNLSAITRHDWNVGALVAIGAPSSPVSFRIDGQWQRLAGVQPHYPPEIMCLCGGPPLPGKQDYRVLDLTTNVIYNFKPTSSANFYVIGGIGAYNVRQTAPVSGVTESFTRFGVNGGAGVKFRVGRVQPFVEARYHSIMGGHTFAYSINDPPSKTFQFVPINVGIVF